MKILVLWVSHQILKINNHLYLIIFSPHIQTLFFITSTFLLNEIVIANNGIFPCENSTLYNKYSIIQNGELTLSKLTLRLGYSIAVVDQFKMFINLNKIKNIIIV